MDFRVDVRGTEDNPEYWIQILANRNEFQDVTLFTPEKDLVDIWKNQPPHHRIIECRFDPEWPGEWRFTRYRDDKDTANHISVMESIIESIQDNVTKEELVGNVAAWRRAWKIRNSEPLGNEDQVEQEIKRFLGKSDALTGQPKRRREDDDSAT